MLSLTSFARPEANRGESGAETTPAKVVGLGENRKKLHFSQRRFDFSNIGGCSNGGKGRKPRQVLNVGSVGQGLPENRAGSWLTTPTCGTQHDSAG